MESSWIVSIGDNNNSTHSYRHRSPRNLSDSFEKETQKLLHIFRLLVKSFICMENWWNIWKDETAHMCVCVCVHKLVLPIADDEYHVMICGAWFHRKRFFIWVKPKNYSIFKDRSLLNKSIFFSLYLSHAQYAPFSNSQSNNKYNNTAFLWAKWCSLNSLFLSNWKLSLDFIVFRSIHWKSIGVFFSCLI